MEALKQRYKLREVSGWPITSLGLYCAVLQPPPGVSRDELVSALADDDGVELVQPVQDFSVF
ncbi:MAG: serine protease, partial [Xanthomonas perforans]|nr:serine protease [Xanthomonas perforans]